MSNKEKKTDGKIINLKEWQDRQKYEEKVEPESIKIEKLYELLHFTHTIKQIMKGELKLGGHVINRNSKECKQLISLIDNFYNKDIFFEEVNLFDLKHILTEAWDILNSSQKY
ncbi:hypothetical protein KW850_04030 [Bacillus sp. sid0103]|uniref:hypothetical protein n=1 Tax=Bacillus sp. sid0103 TaxID=2856337 RepID=UPI001C4449CA|nr:hypothetical protein [Bacillus sp. sid0103]MBV7504433.1 hypothetical protein [Bacillus sp. sid0103]